MRNMHKITDKIWLGAEWDANNPDVLEPCGIKSTVNVAIELGVTSHVERSVSHGLVDGPGNLAGVFWDAVQDLMRFEEECPPVLLHCIAGISRSPCVLACTLALRNGTTIENELNHIASIRGCVDPAPALIQLAESVLRQAKRREFQNEKEESHGESQGSEKPADPDEGSQAEEV